MQKKHSTRVTPTGRTFAALGRRRPTAASYRRRLIAAAGVSVLILAAMVGRAAAYMTASGSVNAAAGVASLPATTLTATPGAGTVALTWTPVTAPPGTSVTYYVTRTGGAVGGNCPSAAASATTATSCTDSGLSKSTYSYTVTAIWKSWTSTSETTPATVNSGALARFAVSAPGTATAGAAFSATITAQDAAGNTVTAYTGSQTLGFSGPSNSPNGTAPAYPSAVSFSAGVGVASVIAYDAQSTTLTATQSAVTGTSASIAVAAGADHQIVASAGGTQTAGVAFTATLTTRDAWGNTPTTLSGTKNVSFSGPASSPNASPPVYPATVSFSAGRATASVTLADAQTTTLTVSDTTDGLGGVASGPILVGPASASSFALSTPATQTAGVAFNETITALDAYGNTATAYTGSKTLTFSGPSSSPGGTAPKYPSPVSFSSGVASGSITLYDAQNTTLTATQSTIAGTSGSFMVASNSATQLVFTTQPSGVTAGYAFLTQPVVTADDAYGNVATVFAATVALSIKSGPKGAALSGCTSSVSAAVTTFSGCQVSPGGAGYQLNATDGTLTATSAPFTAANPTTVNKTTAGTYTLTVPAGVTVFTFTLDGAGGGGGRSGGVGGSGAAVSGTITIPASTTNTTFTVVVGGAGAGGAAVAGGAAGSGGTGCAPCDNGARRATNGSGGDGGGGATCLYLSGAPANTIVTVGGGGGGGARSTSATGGAGGGGPSINPGSNTAGSGGTVSTAIGGAGGSTLTAGGFPFAITNTGGAGGTGSSAAGGTGGTCTGGACGPGGTGGTGATDGAGGGGGGEASGGAGGAARSGASNFAAGGGGGSAYTGGTQSGSSDYTVTVSSATNGGGGAGGAAGAKGTAGSVSFTGPALTLA